MIRMRTLLGVALALAATAVVLFATPAQAANPAAMRVNVPPGTQTVGTPFEVTVEITRATATWGGYTMHLLYDTKVLKVDKVERGQVADCTDANWGNPFTQPAILSACVFQETTGTGITEKIQFECIKDGTSALHFITPTEDTVNGTGLFDPDAVPIATDLTDGTVTCGAGGPLETVAVPTNPTSSDVATAQAGKPWTPVPPTSVAATAAAVSTAVAQGTPVPQASVIIQQATAAAVADRVGKTAAAQGTPPASGTAAQGLIGSNDNDSGGSSNTAWIIIGVIVAAVIVVGAGGAFFYRARSRRGF